MVFPMTITLEEALQLGLSHHRAGRLAEAEVVYRRILEFEPNQADAIYFLGRIAHQAGRLDEAVAFSKRAIAADPSESTFVHSLAESLRAQGKLSESVEWYCQALRLKPDYALAHSNLASALAALGELERAESSFREALRLNPQSAECYNNWGVLLRGQGRLVEARTCFMQALRLGPDLTEAHNNLGNVCRDEGKLDEAIGAYRRAIATRPDFELARLNLGEALRETGRSSEAVSELQDVLRIRPNSSKAHAALAEICQVQGKLDEARGHYEAILSVHPRSAPALNSLGAMLHQQGKPEDAQVCFQRALQIDSRSVQAHVNLGYSFQAQGQLACASDCFERALQIEPNHAEAHNSLAVTWNLRGRPDKALAHCRRAVEIDPTFAFAHNSLGVCLQDLGRLDEAIACYRKAVELAPDAAGQHSNLLYALNCDPTCDAARVAAEHRAWGRRHADPLMPKRLVHPNDRTPDRRLRIGYVSPYFRQHAVNTFIEPILASHDHQNFEVFCYSDVAGGDATTRQLMRYADRWRPAAGLADQHLSDAIRNDRIDILMDLSGHIGGNRLLVFARKPAPVQVTYLGYQNTTGMTAMDYRLTDAYADPPGKTEADYTEQLVRLPGSFFCYMPSGDAPPINALPLESNGFVTFGSFNNFFKVTPEVLATWAKLLQTVPRSRLVVLAYAIDLVTEHVYGTFERHGIDANRIEVTDRLPYRQYLELIRSVDFALDPFPFNGHTTTCDCLWQGVPVVTLSGQTYASRFGGSGLETLGLADLIAHTTDEYVQTAARLANDVDRLKQLRGSLRERMAGSPLLDFQTFTRNLEAEYRRMWIRWCAS
jgi:protein O-GlcNAc transferase